MLKEIAFTWASIGVVLGSFGFYLQLTYAASRNPIETFLFIFIVALLIYGNLVYHFSRVGHLHRRRTHAPASRANLEAIYDDPAPAISVLIPSYKEETRVLLQTVLSAALMEYPHRRVIVLFDDPPNATGGDLSALQEARRLVRQLNGSFAEYGQLFSGELERFMARLGTGQLDLPAETSRVAMLYEQVASWLDEWADRSQAEP